MKERPILFSTEMVKAILDGRKTQTRRIIPEKIMDAYYDYDDWVNSVGKPEGVGCYRQYEKEYFSDRSRWEVGDILWVRESAYFHKQEQQWFYKATDPLTDSIEYGYRWKPSIHMPKDACRIFLEITDIKVERLQEISEEDAVKEGVEIIDESAFPWKHYSGKYAGCSDARTSFTSLWQSINGEESWNQNPWVWAIEFKVISTTGLPTPQASVATGVDSSNADH